MRMIFRFSAMVMLGVIISSCSTKEKIIGLKQNIHHDDFEYSVQRVDEAEQIGSIRARGMFYIVAFQVENRAKRVDHRWTNTVAYLIDETGTHHDNDAQAQQELNRVKPFGYKEDYVTPAGATEVTMLVFDLPKDVKMPYLQVRGSTLMGDVFDGSQFSRTKVRLY